MCCLLLAFALLFSMAPADLDAACTAINCQRQSEPGRCISQYGALQVAAAYGIPVQDVPRWDWGEIDAHLWDGVVIHRHYGDPDGAAHSMYCQGDGWIAPVGLRVMRCQDAAAPGEWRWWSVPYLQAHWTGWGAIRGGKP
jgi:hypothetical protein